MKTSSISGVAPSLAKGRIMSSARTRADIRCVAAQWLARGCDIDAGIVDPAGWCHVFDLGHPGAGPIVGKMMDDIRPDQPKPEIPRVAAYIEQDNLRQQYRNIEWIDVGPRGNLVALIL